MLKHSLLAGLSVALFCTSAYSYERPGMRGPSYGGYPAAPQYAPPSQYGQPRYSQGQYAQQQYMQAQAAQQQQFTQGYSPAQQQYAQAQYAQAQYAQAQYARSQYAQAQYAQQQYGQQPYAAGGVRPVNYNAYSGGAGYDGGSYVDPMTGGECYGEYCDPNGRFRGKRIPGQWNRFVYKTPKNLTYPAADQMPGVIQYPYYTCKGPDCFFYDGSTNRQ